MNFFREAFSLNIVLPCIVNLFLHKVVCQILDSKRREIHTKANDTRQRLLAEPEQIELGETFKRGLEGGTKSLCTNIRDAVI